jgi:hypothetical protein
LHWGGFILKQTPMRRLAEDVRSRTTVANSNPEDFRAANFRTEGDRKEANRKETNRTEANRTEINHADEKLDILGAEAFTSRPQVKAAAFMFGAAWGGINGSYMLKGREAELLSKRQIGSSTRQISSSTP